MMTISRICLLILLSTNLLSGNSIFAQAALTSAEGSTCENPYMITLPLENFEGDTEPMGDNYSSNMISPPSYYIDGNDMVFKFTVSQSGLLYGDLTASESYIGAFILQDCPDPDQPALMNGYATSYTNSLTIPSENPNQPQEILLLPGDYFLIVSSYPPPQTFTFTLNLWMEPLFDCPPPIQANVTDITTGSAALEWTETGTATQWDILYGEAGFDPQTSGTLIDAVAENPYELPDLTSNTSYDFYVRAACDENMLSDWTGPETFTTECDDVLSTAFTEGFETESAPPECWQMWYENLSPPAANLMKHSAEAAYSGGRSFRFSSMVSAPPYGQFLRTPQLNFEDSLLVSFMYMGQDNLPVTFTVGTTQDGINWTWQPDVIAAEGYWQPYTLMASPETKYVAIHYKGDFMRHLFVDDFAIDPVYYAGIDLDPAQFSFAIDPGMVETEELTITNTGEAELLWNAFVQQEPRPLSINNMATGTGEHRSNANSGKAGVVMHYDGDNADGIGIQNGGTLMVAAMFPAELTSQYEGYYFKSVDLFLTAGPLETTVMIWGPGTALEPGELLHEQNFQPEEFTWNTVNLSEQFEITGEDLWVGYSVVHDAGTWPAGIDAGPAADGGDWIYLNDQWSRLSQISSFDANFNVRANLNAGEFWLTISPEEGAVSPGDSDVMTLTVNANDLQAGFYESGIVINSNDPALPVSEIPVTLDVITGIDENTKHAVLIFPVPATHVINISATQEIRHIDIYNASGQLIEQIKGSQAESMQIKTSRLMPGTYPATIHLRDGSMLNKKFIIQ